jgi:hypothetical protein
VEVPRAYRGQLPAAQRHKIASATIMVSAAPAATMALPAMPPGELVVPEEGNAV